jgi:hypothetical protein
MHGLPRLAARCLAACVPAVGLLLASGAAASAGVATPVSVTSRAPSAAATRTTIEHLLAGRNPLDQAIPGHLAAPGVSGQAHAPRSSQSSNWSGYDDTGSGFTAVTGRWTQPAITCNGFQPGSAASFWVGIDGAGKTNTVEQDGTAAVCLGYHLPYYFSWWEMYPRNIMQVTGMSVDPGDAITASVVRSGTSYTLKLTDATHPGNSFSTTQTCSDCSNTSAEWIAEAPTVLSSVTRLPDFGTWGLNAATVTSGSASGTISTFTDSVITMADSSGNVEARPGSLGTRGNTFTDTWVRGS